MNEILYILMRNDLPSMNAGKAMAQASHASNWFVKMYKGRKDVEEWENATPCGFGTVLVLSANITDIVTAISGASLAKLPAQTVVDPSYPYRVNQEVASLIPIERDTIPRVVNSDTVNLWRREVTCAFVFGTKEACAPVIGHLPLHP